MTTKLISSKLLEKVKHGKVRVLPRTVLFGEVNVCLLFRFQTLEVIHDSSSWVSVHSLEGIV